MWSTVTEGYLVNWCTRRYVRWDCSCRLHAGCHVIAFTEIEHFTTSMGW